MLQTKYDKLWADSLYTQEFSSVAQSALTLCSPMDCSTSGFPDHHQLLELAQTDVLQVGDPSNGLILCHPLLLLPSDFPSISILSNESVFFIRWTKYWSFSISVSNEYLGLISSRIGWLDLGDKGLSRVFSYTTVQKHQLFGAQLTLWSDPHIYTWVLEKS